MLELNHIHKSYDGKVNIINNLNLHIEDGEYIVLVGPSGCGKSTVLRMIAGLEALSSGQLLLGGHRIDTVSADKRKMAMVFQSYALYPHLTVAENIGFPLKMSKKNRMLIEESVAEIAKHVQIEHLLTRKPAALSGGQQQRVAIARALVRHPEVLLLDEPLSNLDASLRHDMRMYLKKLHQQTGKTMIHVTHDQVEAMTLADRIVVLYKGSIAQIGTPDELYMWPQSIFVAQFIGAPKMNILPVERISKGGLVCINGQELDIVAPAQTAFIGIRPHHWCIDKDAQHQIQIQVVEPLGQSRLYYGLFAGEQIVLENIASYYPNQSFGLSVAQEHVHFFDIDGRRIHVI